MIRSNSLSAFLGRFCKDKRGASAIIFAISLPVLIGFIGLGAEVGLWYLTERKIQSQADMAAYTSALTLRSGGSTSDVYIDGKQSAVNNGFDASKSTIAITIVSGDTVHVDVVSTQPRLFSGVIMGQGSQKITVEAEAKVEPGGPACILALSKTATAAVKFNGSASVLLNGCNIMSNSQANPSLSQGGASIVGADCVYASGTINYSSGLTTTKCTAPVPNVSPTKDPYESLTVPSTPTACTPVPNMGPTKVVTLSPGRYCKDWKVQGDVTLNPGTYILDGADLSVNSLAKLSGSGVTIILTGGGEVTMNGTATINLTAPTSGTYSGIIFYGDRNDTGTSHKINGDSASSLEGAVYFPSGHVDVLGGGSTSGGCLQMIANTIEISGNSNLDHQCTSSGTTDATVPGDVHLTL